MKSPAAQLLAHAMFTLFVVAGALLFYDRAVVRPAQRVGMVDVAEVYRQKEAEFTLLLTKTSSEDDRQKALLMEIGRAHV